MQTKFNVQGVDFYLFNQFLRKKGYKPRDYDLIQPHLL